MKPRTVLSAQAGLSLVELMVSMAVGLLLVAGLALMFANSSRSGNALNQSLRQVENGRYAIELLQDELSMAGFYAEVPLDSLVYALPDACATATGTLGWDISSPAVPTAPMPVMGVTATQALACLSHRRSGTPAFVVHRLSADSVPVTAVQAGSVYVQTSRCNKDSATTPFVVANQAASFVLRERKCDQQTQVRPYVARIYYIADCSECTGNSDGIPTLTMAELRGATFVAVPLVEGVEDMVLEYGFDTTPVDAAATSNASKGVPDIYRTALSGVAGAADNDWANVMSVRMHLLVRTQDASPGFNDGGRRYHLADQERGPFTDGFKRRVYGGTVRLNNVAGRREVPVPATSTTSSASSTAAAGAVL